MEVCIPVGELQAHAPQLTSRFTGCAREGKIFHLGHGHMTLSVCDNMNADLTANTNSVKCFSWRDMFLPDRSTFKHGIFGFPGRTGSALILYLPHGHMALSVPEKIHVDVGADFGRPLEVHVVLPEAFHCVEAHHL